MWQKAIDEALSRPSLKEIPTIKSLASQKDWGSMRITWEDKDWNEPVLPGMVWDERDYSHGGLAKNRVVDLDYALGTVGYILERTIQCREHIGYVGDGPNRRLAKQGHIFTETCYKIWAGDMYCPHIVKALIWKVPFCERIIWSRREVEGEEPEENKWPERRFKAIRVLDADLAKHKVMYAVVGESYLEVARFNGRFFGVLWRKDL